MTDYPKPIVLWTVPRSISTAFERAILTDSNVKVFHEPFTHPYYFGPERVSRRYAHAPPDPRKTYARTLSDLLAPQPGFERTFVKAMAYCAVDALEPATYDRFTNTFLIRDPRRSVPSLHRMSIDEGVTGWTWFEAREAGFRELCRLYDLASRSDEAPVVVDAQDLLEHPAEILRVYCARVGLRFRESMLRWESRSIPAWETWGGWHETAHASTGFSRAAERSPATVDDLPDVVRETVTECMPFYERLHEQRLRPEAMATGVFPESLSR